MKELDRSVETFGLLRLHSLNLETRVGSNHVGPVNIYHRGRGKRRRVCLGRITWFLGERRGGQSSLTGYKGEGGGGYRNFFPMKGDH